MSTYRGLLDELRARHLDHPDFPCFCLLCGHADCLFCYLEMAPDADDTGYDSDYTIREPPLSAFNSIAAYIAWTVSLPIFTPGLKGLGDSKTALENDPLFYA